MGGRSGGPGPADGQAGWQGAAGRAALRRVDGHRLGHGRVACAGVLLPPWRPVHSGRKVRRSGAIGRCGLPTSGPVGRRSSRSRLARGFFPAGETAPHPQKPSTRAGFRWSASPVWGTLPVDKPVGGRRATCWQLGTHLGTVLWTTWLACGWIWPVDNSSTGGPSCPRVPHTGSPQGWWWSDLLIQGLSTQSTGPTGTAVFFSSPEEEKKRNRGAVDLGTSGARSGAGTDRPG